MRGWWETGGHLRRTGDHRVSKAELPEPDLTATSRRAQGEFKLGQSKQAKGRSRSRAQVRRGCEQERGGRLKLGWWDGRGSGLRL